jgi:hypothetical protein
MRVSISGSILKIPVGNKITVTHVKKTLLFKKTSDELEVWQATKKTEVIMNDTDSEAFLTEYTLLRNVFHNLNFQRYRTGCSVCI